MSGSDQPEERFKAESIAQDVHEEVVDRYKSKGASPHSPEARSEEQKIVAERHQAEGVFRRSYAHVAPGTRPFEILKRIAIGTYNDGFIHAGNLAYLSLIALFPFFITAAAIVGTIGDAEDRARAVTTVLSTMPPDVARVLAAPLAEVMNARTGLLLWLGALIGLWTVGSLIETIRDILRRAYGTTFSASFWQYRLYSIGIIVGAVVLLLLSFSAQVLITALEEFIVRVLPEQFDELGYVLVSRAVSALGLFTALYLLFLTLTPSKYRNRKCRKWPGAAFVTGWWVLVTISLPPLLASLLSYDATYGSLAGVMVVLFFFYLIGLGVVVGAELNAALVEVSAHDDIGQADNRMRETAA